VCSKVGMNDLLTAAIGHRKMIRKQRLMEVTNWITGITMVVLLVLVSLAAEVAAVSSEMDDGKWSLF
jgi:hypothetical protein